jgi:hypothetical protein
MTHSCWTPETVVPAAVADLSACTALVDPSGELAVLSSHSLPQELLMFTTFMGLHTALQNGNQMLHYPEHAKPVMLDCKHTLEMKIVQALLHSLQLQPEERSVQYWVVPYNLSAKFMSLLQDFRVVHRSTPGSESGYLLLANVPCHPSVTLSSVVGAPASALQVPMSWVVEPISCHTPSDENHSTVCNKPTEVCLQALVEDQLMFSHAAVLSGVPCRVLFDTGASRSFVDLGFAKQHGIGLTKHANCRAVMGNGAVATVHTASRPLKLHKGDVHTSAVLIGIQLNSAFDVVLGQDFLSKHSAVLDSSTGTVTFARGKVSRPSGLSTSQPLPVEARQESPVTETPSMDSPLVTDSAELSVLSSAQFAKLVRSEPAGAFLCVVKAASEDTVATLDLASDAEIHIGDGHVDVAAPKKLLAS